MLVKKCLRIDKTNDEPGVLSYTVCQEDSYLNGVMQEAISDPRMKQCQVIDKETGQFIIKIRNAFELIQVDALDAVARGKIT